MTTVHTRSGRKSVSVLLYLLAALLVSTIVLVGVGIVLAVLSITDRVRQPIRRWRKRIANRIRGWRIVRTIRTPRAALLAPRRTAELLGDLATFLGDPADEEADRWRP